MKTSHLPDSIGNTTISRLFSFQIPHLFPFFFLSSLLSFFFTVRCANCSLGSRCFSVPTSCAIPRVFFARICKTRQLFTTYLVRALFSPSPLSCFVHPPPSLSFSPFSPFLPLIFFPQFNRQTLPIPASTRYIIRYSGREPGRPIAARFHPILSRLCFSGSMTMKLC